jgi:hypothetical protein
MLTIRDMCLWGKSINTGYMIFFITIKYKASAKVKVKLFFKK